LSPQARAAPARPKAVGHNRTPCLGALQNTQLRLSFYEKRRRQAGWFMLQQDERLYWEQWCVASHCPLHTGTMGLRRGWASVQDACRGLARGHWQGPAYLGAFQCTSQPPRSCSRPRGIAWRAGCHGLQPGALAPTAFPSSRHHNRCINLCIVQPDPFTQDHTSLAYTDGGRWLRSSPAACVTWVPTPGVIRVW
jgi:hypothetical protein